jgi:hypothetical protein
LDLSQDIDRYSHWFAFPARLQAHGRAITDPLKISRAMLLLVEAG